MIKLTSHDELTPKKVRRTRCGFVQFRKETFVKNEKYFIFLYDFVILL